MAWPEIEISQVAGERRWAAIDGASHATVKRKKASVPRPANSVCPSYFAQIKAGV